jgi:hypothetical protein
VTGAHRRSSGWAWRSGSWSGLAGGLFVTARQVGQAIGLAALASIAAARTNAQDGSLVSGYQTAFLVAIGIVAVAVLIVAIQMRARTAAKEPAGSGLRLESGGRSTLDS